MLMGNMVSDTNFSGAAPLVINGDDTEYICFAIDPFISLKIENQFEPSVHSYA